MTKEESLMQWFRNFNIGTKLVLSFLLILGLTALLGIFMIVKLNFINVTSKDVAKQQVPGLLSIAKINDQFGGFRRGEMLMILSKNQEDISKYVKRNQAAFDKIKNEQAAFEKLIDTEEEKKMYGEASKAMQLYFAEYSKIVQLAQDNKDAEAAVLIRGESSKYFNQTLKALEAIVEDQTRQAVTATQNMATSSSAAQIWIVIALAACIAIGLLEAVLIARIISAPLRDLARKAEQI